MSQTGRVCASVNVATTKAGMNVDAIRLMGTTILRIAQATQSQQGFGAAKLVVFANMPEDNPFMAGAFLGTGEAECVINVGVSGPGVVKRSIDRLIKRRPTCSLDEIAEEVKHTAFRVTRRGIDRARSRRPAGVPFGVVDLSLAPTPGWATAGRDLHGHGHPEARRAGTTAAVALLNDAVKKGGAFASSAVGGLSGLHPGDGGPRLAKAVAEGTLTIEKLEAMTAVCSVAWI